jgi:geranylgeranyl reductase family protein
MNNYNVVIIGAGPAGSYLAYKLRNQGLDVLLLEKQKFPRYKCCAGGLTKKAYDFLFSDIENVRSIVEKKVKKGLYVRNGKFTFTKADVDTIYMTYRLELDNFLVKMAFDDKTVYFKDNISIQKINQKDNTITYMDKKKKQSVGYDVLVGAWGCNIRLNKLVGLTPYERFSVSSSWEGPVGPKFSEYFDDYALVQIMKKYPSYAAYIFPKSEMITAGLFTSNNPDPKVFNAMWKDFVKFWRLDDKIKPTYAWIPVRDYMKPIAKKNILLVGDAAGLADPFTGEGLYYDFICGGIASKNILNFFSNKSYDLAFEYNKNINSKLVDVQRWAKFYESMFHYFPNFSFWLGSETALGHEIVISFITGNIKYNENKKILKLICRRILGKKR